MRTEPASLLDPFDLLRGLAARLEQGLEQAANRGVKSSGFTRAMHTALSAALLARSLSGKVQARVFEVLNLPARSDVLQLAEKLQALEDRLIGLSVQIERQGGSVAPARQPLARLSPPRTRKPASVQPKPAPATQPPPAAQPARRKAARARS